MFRKMGILALAVLMMVSAMAIAPASASEQLPPVELKLIVPGDRPQDMDAVLAEIEKLEKPTLNVSVNIVFAPWSDLASKTQLALLSGEDVDLIFDAPWLHMDQMFSQGMYEQLDDLIAEYGPNLRAARPESMWEANTWDGQIIGVPLGTTVGGTRGYHLRKDLREELGIAPLQTHQDLVDYLYAVKAAYPDIIPYAMDKGASDNNWSSWWIEQHNGDPVTIVGHSPGGVGMTFLLYTEGKDSTVVKNIFDDPNDIILSAWNEARQLYLDGIINPDILADNRTGVTQFETGKVAAYVSNSITVEPSERESIKVNAPTAEVEAFGEWVLGDGLNVSDFKVYNFLCIPKNAKNKERSIQFLDWANSTQDIYDLFAYGIKGVNWEPDGDKKFLPLNNSYPYFAYVWVTNPVMDRFDSRMTDEEVAIQMYFREEEHWDRSVLSFFNFNSDSIASELAIFNDVEAKYMPAVGHGVVDPDETLAKVKAEAYDSIKVIQAELQRQLDAHVASLNK
ncbi:ABC transporter substrate-binding protein [Clostridia bacterium]|nr:ABC transporter substrate-binding protein [Clostridia bacterium]